jgi:hypothetical protein
MKCQKKILLISSVLITLIGLFIFIWFCVRGFFYEQFIIPTGIISLEKSSQFGDFIGGCCGALFALVGVLLLFETLRLQRTEISESRYVFKLQQFDNMFFNLLTLYNSIISSMQGKSFFTQKQQSIYQNFNQDGGRKIAKNAYLSFYAENEPIIAQYFRVLYQIFSLISHSKLNEEDKVRYAKIARAQLSKDEIFFLYYNANTIYGNKFRRYINEFNITKHLSILDKLEFKKYCVSLTNIENHLLHVAFFEIRKGIKECIKQNKEWYKTFLQGAIAIKCNKIDAFNIKFIVIRTLKEIPNDVQQGLGFNEFTPEQLSSLFYDFLVDVFLYSNFFLLNDKNTIITSRMTQETTKITITYAVKNSKTNIRIV